MAKCPLCGSEPRDILSIRKHEKMERIFKALIKKPQTAKEVCCLVGINEVTCRKYLNILHRQKRIYCVREQYIDSNGRPTVKVCRWFVSSNA